MDNVIKSMKVFFTPNIVLAIMDESKNHDVQNHCNMYVFLRCQIFCPNVYKHALCFQIARTICIKVVLWIVLCFTAPEVSVNNGLTDHLLKLPATGKLNAECIFVYKNVLDCCLIAVL